MTAYEALAAALDDAHDRRHIVPCQGLDRDAWISDDADALARAAEQCPPCPVIDQCHAAALELKPTAGVWAATKYGEPRRRPRRTA